MPEEHNMPEETLFLEGLYMPRHPHDIIPARKETLAGIEDYAKKSYDAATPLYLGGTGPTEPRWEEMDRYWAGEHAAFVLSQKPYMEFLPGKFFTYHVLTDVVEDSLRAINTELKGASIAEIGCGSALWSLMLAQRGANIHLFDKSWCALEYALYLGGESHFNVDIKDVKQGDFYHLPEKWKGSGGIFDVVIAGGVLEHLSVEDQNRYLQEAFGVLKDGGIIAFTMPNPPSPLNVSSDERKNIFYSAIEKVGKFIYTLRFPMAYHLKGKERSMDDMLTENGFTLQEEQSAILVAPSGPLEKKHIERNPVAKRFYEGLELMCKSGLINPTKDGEERTAALIKFWMMISKNLTEEEKKQIGRWFYVIGRKPKPIG